MGNVSLRAYDPVLRMLTELNIMIFCKGMPTNNNRSTSEHNYLTEKKVILSLLPDYMHLKILSSQRGKNCTR